MSETCTEAGAPTCSKGGELTLLHGRGMNSISETYRLPADEPEHDRLTLQHRLFSLTIGGLYPTSVRETIDRLLSRSNGDRTGEQRAVLDVGSGSGVWAADMAITFPDVRIIGVDLAAAKLARVPPNCTFLIRDLTHGLDEFAGQFDVVHCRCVRGHMRFLNDDNLLVSALSTALKPGGLLLLSDGVLVAVDESFNSLLPAPVSTPFLSYTPSPSKHATSHTAFQAPTSTSWFVRWNTEVGSRMPSRPLEHQNVTLKDILDASGAFRSVEERMFHIPVGWPGGNEIAIGGKGEEMGQLACENFTQFVQSSTPILLQAGIAEDVVRHLAENTVTELRDSDRKIYMGYRYAWAVKGGLEGDE